MRNIVLFASGKGTNTSRIVAYFEKSDIARVVLVVCNRPGAGVLNVAVSKGVSTVLVSKEDFYNTPALLGVLKDNKADLLVLAGFLWLLPAYLLKAFPYKIINIHPALLPKYGGRGMYGLNVHKAVIAAGEAESGITIHYVNENYDEGAILFQAKCHIAEDDTPETLSEKIKQLEHIHYPIVIEKLLIKERNY